MTLPGPDCNVSKSASSDRLLFSEGEGPGSQGPLLQGEGAVRADAGAVCSREGRGGTRGLAMVRGPKPPGAEDTPGGNRVTAAQKDVV